MNTMMDDFKRALYTVKGTFTPADSNSWTVIENLIDCINRLLDDDLMMKPRNRFTFSERTLATRHKLMMHLGEIMAADAKKEHGFFNKAKLMHDSLVHCSVSIHVKRKCYG